MKNPLDKFYTQDDVALALCGTLREIFSDFSLSGYEILEPSAGDGAFVRATEAVFGTLKITAIDIDPKAKHIAKKDFLAFTPRARRLITLGNPPFGTRAKMAVAFFNHAARFSDIIAFIVPLQFEKFSVQKRLNGEFALIFSQVLPADSFLLNGKKYAVRCCFQVWAKENVRENLGAKYAKNLRILTPPPVNHADFDAWQYNNTPAARKYFDKVAFGWDFAVARQGFYDYSRLIFDECELNPRVQYIFFKAKNAESLRRLKRIDFAKLSLKNTTTPGFGKADVVAEYERIKNE